MASKTSVISLFVLILATYCYSLPIEDQYLSSTLATRSNESSTGITIVDHDVKVNMRLMSDDESTDVPYIHSEHASGEEHHMKNKPDKLQRDVYRPTRLSEKLFFTSSPETSTPESSSFGLRHNQRSTDDFLFTTIESSTQFAQRSIGGNDYQSEETSTNSKRALVGQEVEKETSTNAASFSSTFEPSTSSDSFVKYTGLLADKETTEVSATQFEQSTTTPEVEKDEESTSQVPSKSQKFVKTISFIPGKITETKIYANQPSKAVFMRQPNQQENQLTQGQKQPVVETKESDN